jgi:hypothetical protein
MKLLVRWPADPAERHPILGRGSAELWREGNAQRSEGLLEMYRLAGAGSLLRKYTIGPYGRVTLAMAQARAQKIFAAGIDGRDPAEEKKRS